MFGSVQVVVVAVHPKKGQSAKDCEKLSEKYGAFSYDEFGTACWSVYGKAVQINPVEHSIKEGFDIVNFNFNATGKVKAVEKKEQLPGPKELGFELA